MGDVVLEENTSAVDQEGNKKPDLSADNIGKAEIKAMITELSTTLKHAAYQMTFAASGVDYKKEDIMKVATAMVTGSHVNFANQNSWLSDEAQKKTYLTGGGNGIADKTVVIDFYKLVKATAGFRKDFAEFINSCCQESLWNAYWAVRFEGQMREMVSKEFLYSIRLSFAEFDSIYTKYNDASIYDSLQVSKATQSPEEILQNVLFHMDDAIAAKKALGQFLVNTKATAAAGINKLYVLDRATAGFNEFASKEGAMSRGMEKCAELHATLLSFYEMAGDGLNDYLDGFGQLLENLELVFQAGIDAVTKFKTKVDEAPYSVMHYDPLVVKCTQIHLLGTLKEPFSQGTNYNEMARNMIGRLQNLAKVVAKGAP